MTRYFSDKIRVLSLVGVILVMYIHAAFRDRPDEIAGMAANHALQGVISGEIGWLAVPLFFAISGFLFFRDIDAGAPRAGCYGALWGKMKRRCRTLAVPYAIACLFPAALRLALEQIPAATPFTNGNGFSENFSKTVPQLLYMIYVDSGDSRPYAFHLWFLRDLMVIVALSPVLLAVKRLGAKWAHALVAALFAVNTAFPNTPGFVYGLFWFMWGDAFLPRLSEVKTYAVPLAYVTLCAAETLFPEGWWIYWRMVIITLGVTTVWTAYDRLMPQAFTLDSVAWLDTACAYTFFIYLYHIPTISVVKKLLLFPFGHTSAAFALSYLLTPLVFTVIWVLAGMAFHRLLPRVYSVCMGGR